MENKMEHEMETYRAVCRGGVTVNRRRAYKNNILPGVFTGDPDFDASLIPYSSYYLLILTIVPYTRNIATLNP